LILPPVDCSSTLPRSGRARAMVPASIPAGRRSPSSVPSPLLLVVLALLLEVHPIPRLPGHPNQPVPWSARRAPACALPSSGSRLAVGTTTWDYSKPKGPRTIKPAPMVACPWPRNAPVAPGASAGCPPRATTYPPPPSPPLAAVAQDCCPRTSLGCAFPLFARESARGRPVGGAQACQASWPSLQSGHTTAGS